MNTPADDIKDMLVAESALALTFGTNLFVGREPDTPPDCVTVFDTTAGAPQLTLTGHDDYYRPSIQVRVRNRRYVTGWTLAHNIVAALHARSQQTWNGTRYTFIQCSSGPALLEWDENNRIKFIVNFNIQRR